MGITFWIFWIIAFGDPVIQTNSPSRFIPKLNIVVNAQAYDDGYV